MTILTPSLLKGSTRHGRVNDPVPNRFAYAVDYLLVPLSKTRGKVARPHLPWLLGWDQARRPFALLGRDHGFGSPKSLDEALNWARSAVKSQGFSWGEAAEVWLLTQARQLGFVFNPVSFWFFVQEGALRGLVAEVNNTFGQRHAYVCAHADERVLEPNQKVQARKVFYVSPFQTVEGIYSFQVALNDTDLNIQIELTRPNAPGFYADLRGTLVPLSAGALARVLLRRPLGSWRVLALIHWQALRLYFKRARFISRPKPPQEEVTR